MRSRQRERERVRERRREKREDKSKKLCEAVLLLFTAKVVPGVTIDDVDLNCIADI